MKTQQTKTGLRNLTILLGGTCSVLAAIMISPALPGMAEAFAETPDADFLVRMVLTMPALFVALGALLIGPLLDRWGRKPVICLSLVLFALAGSVVFVLDSLFLILVSRALLGIAVAGIMSGFMALIMDYFEGQALDRFLGLNGASICLGGIVGLIAAGLLADMGWRYPFLVHLIGLVILPGVIFTIREPEKANGCDSQVLDKPKIPWRALWPVCATAFSCTVLFFMLPANLPFYLLEHNDIEPSKIGLALALPTIIGFVFAILYSRIRARLSVHAIAGIIFITYCVTYLILSSSGAFVPVVCSLLIGGIGVGLLSPNNSGWLASVVNEDVRGKAVGLLTCSIFLGQFFSPIITQPFVQGIGLVNTFVLMAGVSAGVAIIFFVLTARASKADAITQGEQVSL